MHIDVVELGTPEAEAWADRWYDAWYEALYAGLSHDRTNPVLYPAERLRAALSRTTKSERRFFISLVDDDTHVVGAARVLLPGLDNTDLAFFEMAVPPTARRRGHGTALLRAVRDLATAHGRTLLQTDLDRSFDQPAQQWPGSVFAAARGFRLGLEDVRRDLQLPTDPEYLAELERRALAHADGYGIATRFGRTPAEDRSRMATLMARMSTDAPLGDLAYEPEAWDADRVAEQEEHLAALGNQWWTAVAVAPDGTWAGYTQLHWSAHTPERLEQEDTLVLREHRGRRLGLLLKLATLRRAEQQWPGAKFVTTWNAASNAPMIAVNEALGFRAVEASEEWQARVDDLVGL
ncbi:MAG TPA: GNAT family N-acetyltransferase [Actinomycetales bacterium]|nr:GNAT family N-acetyltransferase [Actinomycetales bacterium]